MSIGFQISSEWGQNFSKGGEGQDIYLHRGAWGQAGAGLVPERESSFNFTPLGDLFALASLSPSVLNLHPSRARTTSMISGALHQPFKPQLFSSAKRLLLSLYLPRFCENPVRDILASTLPGVSQLHRDVGFLSLPILCWGRVVGSPCGSNG